MTKSQQVLTDVTAARDEVRVRLHLLSMDAQDQWRELENAFENLEHKLKQGGEDVASTLRDREQKLSGKLHDFLRNQFGLAVPVRSIMTENVFTCLVDESLNQAARIFWERNCGAVPVVDAEGKLLGMLTDRDICIAAYTQGRPLGDINAASVMSRAVHSASPSDSIERVLKIMSDAQVHRVPIVDEQQRVVGIVAMADIARWLRQLPAAHVSVSQALLGALSAISMAPGLPERGVAAE
jgi:CBS domain-containing protein